MRELQRYMRVTSHDYQQMDTDGDDYAYNRQLVPVDVVTPISHDISTSSSITPDDDSAVKKVSPTTSKFTLPKGWYVKKVLRKFGGAADKYYRDPETGRYFRSLREVERYVTEGVLPSPSRKRPIYYDEKVERDITEGVTPSKTKAKRLTYHHDENVEKDITEGVTPTKTKAQRLTYHHDENVERDITEGVTPSKIRAKRLSYHRNKKMLDLEENKDNQNQLAIVSPTSISRRSPFNLPDGWIVEEVPRRSGNYIDRYYHEPGTGQRFRSLVAVQNYLAELEEHSPLSVVLEEIKENNLPISKAFKLSCCIKNCGSYNSWKKSVSRKEKTSSIASPPSKINWVIAGSGADDWNAFVDETLVQESVKQQWGNAFMIAINTKQNTPHTRFGAEAE